MEHNDPEEIVKRQYANPVHVAQFTTVGLWPSEAELIERYFKPGGVILDIGCGAGRTTIPLAKQGYRVTGIDFVPEMIEAARVQAREHAVDLPWRVMDVCHMDFAPEEFDGALFAFNGYEVLTTREKRAECMRSIARVLRPGGTFIVTARSGVAVGRRWLGWCWMFFRHFILRPLHLSNPRLQLGDQYRNDVIHHYITPFTVRQELQAAGFELQFFNSSRNIDRNRPANFFTNFSNDKCLFFVARKIG